MVLGSVQKTKIFYGLFFVFEIKNDLRIFGFFGKNFESQGFEKDWTDTAKSVHS